MDNFVTDLKLEVKSSKSNQQNRFGADADKNWSLFNATTVFVNNGWIIFSQKIRKMPQK